MLKIGEFSRLSQVPVKTLRFYDEIGLFAPDFIDPSNGYRYYALSQLGHINQIKMLKELGFSLDQISQMLAQQISQDELRGMLRMKLAELEQESSLLDQRRRRLQHQLNTLTKEDAVSEEVTVKSTKPVRVISTRAVIENYKNVGPLYEKLDNVLSTQNIQPAGPCMAVFYDEEYKEKDVDVEAIFPIGDADVTATDSVNIHELPAVPQMATYLRKGPYDDFTAAYQTLMGWISESGYQIVGPNREIYIRDPGDGGSPEDCLVELQFPVRKRK